MSRYTKRFGFVVYTIYTVVSNLVSLPAYLAAYAVPALRPNGAWSFYQSFSNHLTRIVLDYLSVTEFPTPQIDSIKPGLGDLVRIKAGPDSLYQDVLDVKPTGLAAIWVPARPGPRSNGDELVVLHFHGGAFVLLSPGMTLVQRGPRLLASALGTSVLMADYRLSCHAGSHFPAALQDAITAYKYLLDEGYSADQIVLSGDSAGGNLVFALLRYIGEHSDRSGRQQLSWPAAALTWSPWTDMTMTEEYITTNPNYHSDVLTPAINAWGLRAYIPASMSPSMPYFSPGRHPFHVGCKLFIHSGSAELLSQQHREAAAAFKAVPTNEVELYQTANTPHDIFAGGQDIGFAREQQLILQAAVKFVTRSRSG